jgi:transcription initiation factor TFIID TATA-box-binding protein
MSKVKWDKKLENLVVSVSIDQRINLEQFSRKAKDIEYDPDHFPGAIYRMKEPRVSALIFSSGKVNCTGARHWDEIPLVVEQLRKKFKEGGIIPKTMDHKVQNLVVSANLGYEINIDIAATELDNVEYEPEQFPGLIFRLQEPKCVTLVFTSGKINVVGAKVWENIDKAIEKVDKALKEVGAVME